MIIFKNIYSLILNKRVLLTGASGFIGSHIAEALLHSGYSLLLLKRTTTNLWRCSGFEGNYSWLDVDCDSWEDSVLGFKPEVIINSAWSGVVSGRRDEWEMQLSNILFQQKLLEIAKKSSIYLFVGLGSQAEYGFFDGVVNEYAPLNPTTAYGATKVACCQILSAFCNSNEIKWRWFRVFSVFGEKEDENWLIPSTIKKLSSNKDMDLTSGMQKYAYLYVRDFANVLVETIEKDGENGIYNFSSIQALKLKEILDCIQRKVNTQGKLNFGKIPYRSGQAMHVEGDMRKFNSVFGRICETNFEQSLNSTIEFYLNHYLND